MAALDDAVHRAHARHYLAAAASADERYAHDEDALAELLKYDDANVRAALGWAWAHEPGLAVRDLGSLLYVWFLRDRNADVREWSERVLSSTSGTSRERARVAAARLATLLWEGSGEEQELHKLSDLIRPHVPSFDDEWHRRWVTCQSQLCRQAGDFSGALAWQEQYRVNTPRDKIRTAVQRGDLLAYAGRYTELVRELDVVLQMPELPSHRILQIQAFNARGYVAVVLGDLVTGRSFLDLAMAICDTLGMPIHGAMVRNNQAWLALGEGAYMQALLLARQTASEPAARTDRVTMTQAATIAGLALHALGRRQAASELAAAAAATAMSRHSLLDAFEAAKVKELTAATGVGAGDPADTPAEHLAALVLRAATATSS